MQDSGHWSLEWKGGRFCYIVSNISTIISNKFCDGAG